MDADYAVRPEWLKDLIPAFTDPKVGLIQAPQDHRDGAKTAMHRAMCAEYAGFFDIGMVLRNEANAIIVHGTMCLIRKSALDGVGGWSSDTICEDTDLGLTLLEHGWLAHYTDRRYGYGLLPDSFEAYKKQRHRWASGGLQIAKKHCRRLLAGTTLLLRDQRREFAMGWLNWLGAESVGVLGHRQPGLGPGRCIPGDCDPRQNPHPADHRGICGDAGPFHRALPRAGRAPAPASRRRHDRGHGDAVDSRARSRLRPREGTPAVCTTAKGGNGHRRAQFPAFYEGIFGSLLVLGAASCSRPMSKKFARSICLPACC